MLRLPIEKKDKALSMLQKMLDRKKATVRELQELYGYLNFLSKAIFPGRPFIRRMYAKCSQIMKLPSKNCHKTEQERELNMHEFKLKPHHHVRLDQEFKVDCKVWVQFLSDNELSTVVNRPMIDVLSPEITSEEICFYSDASTSKFLRYGCIFNTKWIRGDWEKHFIETEKPSIEYLGLFALCAGIFTWQHLLANTRIIIFCNNTAVCGMVNSLTSS